MGQKLGGANTETQKLHNHALELIDKVKRLQIEKTRQDISHTESIAKNAAKTEEIKLLRNEMKSLKGKLALSQKDSLNKGSEIESLKSKIVELALKVSELERLKSEDVLESIVGGNNEKNISKLDNGSVINKDNKSLRPYLVRRKSMDESEKIDNNGVSAKAHIVPVHDELIPDISPNTSPEDTYISSIPDIPPGDTYICFDVSSSMLKSVTTYLAQWENNTPSLVESNFQIPIGGWVQFPLWQVVWCHRYQHICYLS